ncbi:MULTISPECIES: DUF6882 domain-containing protein [unclassified Agarivorans]|uniref:DUF6882 domain-containing protein n=1 Tax=unclassified Agarivorans TaxID=2636026 RepID=UPI003D7CA1A6
MKKLIASVISLFASSANASDDWIDFVTIAHNSLSEKQDAIMAEYKIGEHERFDWDQENGTLVFSNDDKPVVIAKVQFVGSVSTKSDTWLWSWANQTILDNVKDQMYKVKEFGVSKNYEALINEKWSADEVDGWEMTSITSYILNAKGAYRTTDNTGFTYMVITDIHWVK